MSTISASTTSTTAYKVTADTTGTLVLQTGASPTTAVTIDTSQNITAVGNITLNNGAADGAQLSLSSSGYSNWNIDNYSGNFRFYYNTTEYMRIDSSGNVGINMQSPSTWGKLVVADSTGSAANADVIVVQTGYSPSSYRKTGLGWTDGNNITGRIATTYNGTTIDMTFGSLYNSGYNSNELMRLTGSGNLLVGITSVVASGTSNSVQVNSGVQGYQFVSRYSGAASGKYWHHGPDSGNNYVFYNQGNTGVYITDGGTSWSANSDERLKTALTPFENATEKVCSLRAGTGRYLTDDESVSRSFLIAQDVQAVLPEAVNVQSDEMGTLGLAYTDLIPLLTAAIQELKAELDAAKADIATLKGAA